MFVNQRFSISALLVSTLSVVGRFVKLPVCLIQGALAFRLTD
nr:MAG TPA: hypothetical protein [Siphoviridae sp. ctEci12]